MISQNSQETEEIANQLKLKEILYNCSECSSPIDISSIDEEKYECFCVDCNRHLCKECLKTRNHVNHQKNSITETQQNKNELKIVNDIIKFYEEKIDNSEKEKLKKIIPINNKYKKYRDRMNKMKELNKKKYEDKMQKEIKIIRDKYLSDRKKMGEDNIKLRKHKYYKEVNDIKKKYKIKIESNNILYKNKIDKLDNTYKKIKEKIGYNRKIENLKYIKRLIEIIFNTYNIYNNNYFNSKNINNVLMIYHDKRIYIKEDLDHEYENIKKIQVENEQVNNLKSQYEFQKKLMEIKHQDKLKEIMKNNHRLMNNKIKDLIMNSKKIIGGKNNRIKKLESELNEIKIKNDNKDKEIVDYKNKIDVYEKQKKENENQINQFKIQIKKRMIKLIKIKIR